MKPTAKALRGIIAALGLFSWNSNLHASPIDDLGSPSQEIRDAAAKTLRKTYTSPPSTNWDALVSTLKLGTPQSVIEAQLRASNFAVSGSTSFGSTDVKWYRLDDLWLLHCTFTNTMSGLTNRALDQIALKEQMREIWVKPPSNFTGVWRTFWANGQPSYEFHYKDGLPEGVLTTFYPDGAKCVVSPQHNGIPAGEEMGFYSSGRIKYKGQYRAGSQVGRWIWYKEDGSVEETKDYNSK